MAHGRATFEEAVAGELGTLSSRLVPMPLTTVDSR